MRFGDEYREKHGLFPRRNERFISPIVEKHTNFLDFSGSFVNIYHTSNQLVSSFGISAGFSPLPIRDIGLRMYCCARCRHWLVKERPGLLRRQHGLRTSGCRSCWWLAGLTFIVCLLRNFGRNHVALTKQQPVDVDFGEGMMNRHHMIVGGIRSSCKNAGERSSGNTQPVREVLLRHVYMLHDGSYSLFHIYKVYNLFQVCRPWLQGYRPGRLGEAVLPSVPQLEAEFSRDLNAPAFI